MRRNFSSQLISEIFSNYLMSFQENIFAFFIFYVLSSDFAFPASVSWYRWWEDLTWSYKDFQIAKLWDVFSVECFNHK